MKDKTRFLQPLWCHAGVNENFPRQVFYFVENWKILFRRVLCRNSTWLLNFIFWEGLIYSDQVTQWFTWCSSIGKVVGYMRLGDRNVAEDVARDWQMVLRLSFKLILSCRCYCFVIAFPEFSDCSDEQNSSSWSSVEELQNTASKSTRHESSKKMSKNVHRVIVKLFLLFNRRNTFFHRPNITKNELDRTGTIKIGSL